MAPMFSLRAFYFYLILICCFLEIFGGRYGRIGRGRGYSAYGSKELHNYSSSSGTSSGTGNYGSSSTSHGTENKASSHSSTTDNNGYTNRIGHNFAGNGNREKFNDRLPSSSDLDNNNKDKHNNRPQIDWGKLQEKQREIHESFERINNWKLGSFGSHKYGSSEENPYGNTYKNPYETILKDLSTEQKRIFSESGLYTHKADTHTSAVTPSGSLSTIRNQELKGGRDRNSRRSSVGSSKCDVRKLTNDLNIWVCSRINKQKECTIKCIEPKKFSGIAADKYTCRHGIWTPNHVPLCI
ncbi:uncharacterized protein [Parasteatoda tepidariorum]|uniref:uncharacterized protein n=1 Tax=Parasteatoda tepidariorum TaxID=114398 RepID=UPI001C720F32|nr:putative uncharacterized protein DDB_G0281733 isoform X2 [Parasteatoda tepidariorum]XP_042901386.1 putative uncharacterized protein DDB_G0281733 isoform X3 [Parasteatoda tepidariorum]